MAAASVQPEHSAVTAKEPEVVSRSWAPLFLLTGLSLWIGWGIRGNYGHEFGAMIPGALATMAAVLLSGRADWQRRIAFFGAFGALGWCLGGSNSYMQVIAYTHSGHSPTVLYGFACLWMLGFLWAAAGGAGAALPMFLTRERLIEFIAPLSVVFCAFWLRDIYEGYVIAIDPQFRQNDPLYWWDSDWTAALIAPVVVLLLAAIRRRWDTASSLIVTLCAGWWAGFLLFPIALNIHMTPPRSDNWAGSLGLVVALFIWLWRNKLHGVVFAALVTGLIGGLGFAGATMLKLIEIKGGWQTNYHSILEQTYGLVNGLGLAATFVYLIPRAPKVIDEPPVHRWADWFAPAWVLLFITYVNLRENPEQWVKAKAIPADMYGLQAITWFNLAYLAVAIAVIVLMIRHQRRPLSVIPSTWLGKGQLLYLALLWWIVIGNFGRAVTGFAPQRLITEGTIHFVAVASTVLVLIYRWSGRPSPQPPELRFATAIRRALLIGVPVVLASIVLEWGIVRAIWGDKHAGYSGLHIRFGPNANAKVGKPKPNAPHP